MYGGILKITVLKQINGIPKAIGPAYSPSWDPNPGKLNLPLFILWNYRNRLRRSDDRLLRAMRNSLSADPFGENHNKVIDNIDFHYECWPLDIALGYHWKVDSPYIAGRETVKNDTGILLLRGQNSGRGKS